MYTAQQSLKVYLQQANLGTAISTVKEYAAELANINDNALRIEVKLPAVLLYFRGPIGFDMANAKNYGHVFYLYVITETHTMDKDKGNADNLLAVQRITDFLRDHKNADFGPQGQTGTYVIQSDQVMAFPFLHRPRFTIHYISCPVIDCTKRVF